MNTYTTNTNEAKSKAAVNSLLREQRKVGSTSQLHDNSPGAIAQRKLHAMVQNSPQVKQAAQLQSMSDIYTKNQQRHSIQKVENNTGLTDNFKSGTTTVQRYADANGGGKVSGNNLLLVRNPNTAFAHPSKFEAANALGGQVQFNQGANAPAPYNELVEILPVAREGSELSQNTAHFDVLQQEGSIKQRAEENYYPTEDEITDSVMEAMEEHYGDDFDESDERDEIMTFFGTTDYGEIREMIETLANLVAELLPAVGNYHQSGVNERIDQYMQAQVINQNRPLMPSDCGLMAQAILGNNVQLYSENPQVLAGLGYHKGMNLENRENAEWNEHFAAIIMTDGNDHITMENAGAKSSEKFGKAQYDKTWFFEMYGTGEGQSFAAKYDRELGY